MSRTLHELIEKLADSDDSADDNTIDTVPEQGDLVDPVYVEKLASAVDFLSDNVESLVFGETPVVWEQEKTASVDFTDAIRNSLKEKLAAATQPTTNDSDLDTRALDSILSRLHGLDSEEAEEGDETDDAVLDDAFTAEAGESGSDTFVEEGSLEDDEEGDGETMKAASDKLSLAEMLRNALGNAEERDGSADTASVKTSSIRGNGLTKQEAVTLLKSKLSSDLVI